MVPHLLPGEVDPNTLSSRAFRKPILSDTGFPCVQNKTKIGSSSNSLTPLQRKMQMTRTKEASNTKIKLERQICHMSIYLYVH